MCPLRANTRAPAFSLIVIAGKEVLVPRCPTLKSTARSFLPRKHGDPPSRQVQSQANMCPEPGRLNCSARVPVGDMDILTDRTPAKLLVSQSSSAAFEENGCNIPFFQPYVSRRWTAEDTDRLLRLARDAMSKSNPEWKQIAASFPGRTKNAVALKFYKLQPGVRCCVKRSLNISYRRWQQPDMERLVRLARDAISASVRPGWERIAKHFPSRSATAVAQMFYKLQPGVMSYANTPWDERSTSIALGLASQQANMRSFVENLPNHSLSQLLKTRSLLRRDPASIQVAVDGRQRAETTAFSDPAPLKQWCKWSRPEIAQLKYLRSQRRHPNWIAISKVLGRSPSSCQSKCWRLGESKTLPTMRVRELGEWKSPTGYSARWSAAEIRKLVEFVSSTSAGPGSNWALLLESLPGRSVTACARKWERLRSVTRTKTQ